MSGVTSTTTSSEGITDLNCGTPSQSKPWSITVCTAVPSSHWRTVSTTGHQPHWAKAMPATTISNSGSSESRITRGCRQ